MTRRLQVSHESREMLPTDLEVITTSLAAAQVEALGSEVGERGVLLRFDTVEDQLRAKTAIEESLTDDFIVALNLAPTTPAWMQAIGAGKMNLGLDLQGGVHFLMEVDMEAAVLGRMEDNLSNVRSILRELRIRTRGLNMIDFSHIEVRFADADDRSRARSELLDKFPELVFQNRETAEVFILDLRMTEDTMLQIQRDTLQANRTTLLNRVDALGVFGGRPCSSRAQTASSWNCRGFRIRPRRFASCNASPRWSSISKPALGSPRTSYEAFDYVATEGVFPVNVDNDVILQGDRVSNVRPSLDQNGLPQVQISLDAQGGNQINRVTRDNVGRMMDILLIETRSRTNLVIDENGEETEEVEFYEESRLISHARINSALGRQFVITGLTQREAMDLSLLISSGSLAAPMTIVEQSVIGPTMGREKPGAGRSRRTGRRNPGSGLHAAVLPRVRHCRQYRADHEHRADFRGAVLGAAGNAYLAGYRRHRAYRRYGGGRQRADIHANQGRTAQWDAAAAGDQRRL